MFPKGYRVREIQTMIAHIASGLGNHGFREHKSSAIYAFLCLKVPYVRQVADNEPSGNSFVLLQTSYEIRMVCSTGCDAFHHGANSKL
jgi:hypothetical protein